MAINNTYGNCYATSFKLQYMCQLPVCPKQLSVYQQHH